MSVTKKHLTANAIIIQSDDGVYAQQVNYGTSASTPSNRSVTDVIVRHFEDYASKFVVDKIKTGFICSWAGGSSLDITVSVGTANVKGIEVNSDGIITVTIPATADTYYVVLQKGDDEGTSETRIPLNDTIVLTRVTDGAFDEDTDFAIAKVITNGTIITSFEDWGASYTLRADYIKPKKGSTIKVFTGTFPEAVTEVAYFSGTKIVNAQDGAENGAGLYTGYDKDFHFYHLSGTGNIINNQNSQDMWVALNGVSKFGFRSTGFEVVDNLIVSGTSSLIGNVGIGGTLTVSGTLQVIGDITMDSDELILNDNARIGIDSDTDLLTLKDQILILSGSLQLRDASAYIGSETDPNLITLQNAILLLSGSLELEDDKYVGIESDTDLMQLKSNNVIVNGTVTSTVYFSGVDANLSSLTASRLLASNGDKDFVSADLYSWVTQTANQVLIANDGDGTITFSLPQNINTGATPIFVSADLTGLTSNRLVYDNGSALASVSNLASWIAGTTNRITVTDDLDGTVTLSLPQDLDTGADLQLGSLTLTTDLAVAHGGMGRSTLAAGSILYGAGTSAVGLAGGSDHEVMMMNGSTPTFVTINGDITAVGDATNLTLSVVNDSHTHDGRYYTESEMDTTIETVANLDPYNTTDVQLSYLGNLDDIKAEISVQGYVTKMENSSDYMMWELVGVNRKILGGIQQELTITSIDIQAKGNGANNITTSAYAIISLNGDSTVTALGSDNIGSGGTFETKTYSGLAIKLTSSQKFLVRIYCIGINPGILEIAQIRVGYKYT